MDTLVQMYYPMDKNRLKRRQFLLYSGLGITGVGTAFVFNHFSNENGFSSSNINNPTSGNATSESPELIQTAQAASNSTLPEFQGISQWLNSTPLSIASLKGKVVLIQFWTLGCINCQRTLPYIVQWHQKYAAQGLKIIGVHTPEFAYERDPNNVKRAIKDYKITYPVPMDNAFKTWKAYRNRYWPNLYLADRQGVLRYSHAGEGAYDTTEQLIRKLLG
jgi:thiol-disulfide isomerase/thioredoxin